MSNEKSLRVVVLARRVRWFLKYHSREEFINRMEYMAKNFESFHIISMNTKESNLPIGECKKGEINYHGIPLNIFTSIYFLIKIKKINPDIIFVDVTGYGKKVLMPLVIVNAKKIIFVQGFYGIDERLIEDKNIILRYFKKVKTSIETKILFKVSARIFCVSESLKNFLLQKYRLKEEKVIFIPHSMEYVVKEINKTDGFNEWIEKSDIKKILIPENRIIFSTGKLSKLKRFDLVIKSFYYTQKKLKNAFLIIAGQGPELRNLKKMKEYLEIQGKIFFIGEIPRSFVLKLIQKSDLFLFASKSEGFGKSYVEALALDCPLICSRNETVIEVTDTEGAVIIDFENPQLYAEKIVEVLQNKEKYNKLKENGRKSVNRYLQYPEKDRYNLIIKEIYKVVE